MAIPRIKATYSLDVDTTRLLERLAENWSVSKSEALRRAIRATARRELQTSKPDAALASLQEQLALTAEAVREWEERAATERRSIGEAEDKAE